MLRIDRSEVCNFGHADVSAIFQAGGWRALLPNALSDPHLLRTAEDLRSLLSDDEWDDQRSQESPVFAMAILLLESCGPVGDAPQYDVATLQDAMSMLSLTVDREIVSRLLDDQSDETEEALTAMFRMLAERRAMPQR
jgi:hypothetical protein